MSYGWHVGQVLPPLVCFGAGAVTLMLQDLWKECALAEVAVAPVVRGAFLVKAPGTAISWEYGFDSKNLWQP
ncbi:MAG: hypothetical protein OHK0012_07190 [Synechococcales cyanobacterium]